MVRATFFLEHNSNKQNVSKGRQMFFFLGLKLNKFHAFLYIYRLNLVYFAGPKQWMGQFLFQFSSIWDLRSHNRHFYETNKRCQFAKIYSHENWTWSQKAIVELISSKNRHCVTQTHALYNNILFKSKMVCLLLLAAVASNRNYCHLTYK